MFREQAQAQARHRIRAEEKGGKVGLAKSLRDQKQKVKVMGMLGIMHQKFGAVGGPQAVIHSMFESLEGFGDETTEEAKAAAEKIYLAALNGDEEALQKELEPRVQAYEEWDAANASGEPPAEPEPASPPKKPAKGKKEEVFEPQLAVTGEAAPEAAGPPEPVWSIRDARGVEPLAHAAARGHTGACGLLLAARASVSASAPTCGRAALHRAAEGGHVETVRALLEAKADVLSCQLNGQSALHSACAYGHTELVAALIEAGAPPEQPDLLELTPLAAACEGGHASVVAALMGAGVGLDAIDAKGWSALHYALSSGHVELALTLVRAGAAVGETRGGQPLSALHAQGAEAVDALVLEMNPPPDEDEDEDEDGDGEPRPVTAPR
jgi:ankyrin repeat protein